MSVSICVALSVISIEYIINTVLNIVQYSVQSGKLFHKLLNQSRGETRKVGHGRTRSSQNWLWCRGWQQDPHPCHPEPFAEFILSVVEGLRINSAEGSKVVVSMYR